MAAKRRKKEQKWNDGVMGRVQRSLLKTLLVDAACGSAQGLLSGLG